jgi:hypothetical protein
MRSPTPTTPTNVQLVLCRATTHPSTVLTAPAYQTAFTVALQELYLPTQRDVLPPAIVLLATMELFSLEKTEPFL